MHVNVLQRMIHKCSWSSSQLLSVRILARILYCKLALCFMLNSCSGRVVLFSVDRIATFRSLHMNVSRILNGAYTRIHMFYTHTYTQVIKISRARKFVLGNNRPRIAGGANHRILYCKLEF